MKIVINRCYGGFSLSHQAIMRYAELSGFKLHTYIHDYKNNTLRPYKEGDKETFTHYYKQPRTGDRKIDNENYISVYDFERTDPILIQVIEELGPRANGNCAELTVIEIPDNIEYTIEDYDGIEHIAEIHRTWP